MVEDKVIKYIAGCIFYEPTRANLHDAYVFLEYALQGINSKKDLTDEEILTIKCIRTLIKGL